MRSKSLLKTLLLASTFVGFTANAGLIHDWQLNGNTTDSMGGSDAVLLDAAGLTGTGYNFTASQGLSVDLTGLVDPGNYTIEFSFSLTAYQSSVANSRGGFSGYQKIIDFENLLEDEGFYTYDDYFYFYDISPDLDDITFDLDELMTITLTRDSATDVFSAYLNGIFMWSFVDDEDHAVADEANNRLHFFQDDVTTEAEDAEGFVDYIRVFDDVRAPDPIDVPEPATFWLLSLACGGLLLRRKRA